MQLSLKEGDTLAVLAYRGEKVPPTIVKSKRKNEKQHTTE